MQAETTKMAPRDAEVLMLAAKIVKQIEQLAQLGWGAKRISRELGVARGTMRRYLRGGDQMLRAREDGESRGAASGRRAGAARAQPANRQPRC